MIQETCGGHEFECDNKICISVDCVCDNINDCMDNSDERNCGELIVADMQQKICFSILATFI